MRTSKLFSFVLVILSISLLTTAVLAGGYIKRKNVYLGKINNLPVLTIQTTRSSEIKKLKKSIAEFDLFLKGCEEQYQKSLKRYAMLLKEVELAEKDLDFKSATITINEERRNNLKRRLNSLKPNIGRCY